MEVEKSTPCHMLRLGYSPLADWAMLELQQRAAVTFSETDSLMSPTEMEPMLDPRKLEKENTHQFIWFSPGSQVGVHFPFVVVTSFLSGAVSDLSS